MMLTRIVDAVIDKLDSLLPKPEMKNFDPYRQYGGETTNIECIPCAKQSGYGVSLSQKGQGLWAMRAGIDGLACRICGESVNKEDLIIPYPDKK